MSPFDFAREKTLTGGEARAVGAAVARAVHANDVGALVSELARTVRSAERVMAARGERLDVVRSPIGLPVPVGHLLDSREGIAITERMGRFFILRPSTRSPLMLPPWSVDNMALTRSGVRAINRATLLRPFSVIRDELLAVLAERDSACHAILASITRGATGATVLSMWPEHSAAILKVLRR